MRDRFSTAIFCDFCGKGLNEVADMIAAPVAHICGGCVELSRSVILARRATTPARPGVLSPIAAGIDYGVEARTLQRSLKDHAYPDAGGGADIDNNATPLIEGTLRAIATLAVNLDRRRHQEKPHG